MMLRLKCEMQNLNPTLLVRVILWMFHSKNSFGKKRTTLLTKQIEKRFGTQKLTVMLNLGEWSIWRLNDFSKSKEKWSLILMLFLQAFASQKSWRSQSNDESLSVLRFSLEYRQESPMLLRSHRLFLFR